MVLTFQRQLSTGKIVPPVRKTSSSKSPGSGILINKSTTAVKPAPPANGTIETLNHFDKSHPKDDLEIKKHRDESIGRTANKKDNKKGVFFVTWQFSRIKSYFTPLDWHKFK